MDWHHECPICNGIEIVEPSVPWIITKRDWCLLRALNIDPEVDIPTE